MKPTIIGSNVAAGSKARQIRIAILVIAMTGIMTLASVPAQSQCPMSPLNLLNNCFEADILSPGMGKSTIKNWTIYNPDSLPVGVYYPRTLPTFTTKPDYFAPVPSPNNVAYITNGGASGGAVIYQNTKVQIQPYTIYTLSAWVGQPVLNNRFDVDSSLNALAIGDSQAFLSRLGPSNQTPLALTIGGPFREAFYSTSPLGPGSAATMPGHTLQVYLTGGQWDNVTLSSATSCSDCYNQFVPKPRQQGYAFQAVIAGNVVANIDTVDTQNDPTLNPFAWVNANIAHTGTSSITAALDANGNTVVTFTGSNPILSFYSFSYGASSNGYPHFGVDGLCTAACPSFAFLSQQWIENAASPVLAALSVSTAPPSAGTLSFAVIFQDVANAAGVVGQWNEEPFTRSAQIPLTFTNNTGSPETLSGVEYLICAQEIPLDQLNISLTPPPGCGFLPIRQLDGMILESGQSVSVTVNTTPEPSTFLLMGTGLLGLAGGLRRLSQPKR